MNTYLTDYTSYTVRIPLRECSPCLNIHLLDCPGKYLRHCCSQDNETSSYSSSAHMPCPQELQLQVLRLQVLRPQFSVRPEARLSGCFFRCSLSMEEHCCSIRFRSVYKNADLPAYPSCTEVFRRRPVCPSRSDRGDHMYYHTRSSRRP